MKPKRYKATGSVNLDTVGRYSQQEWSVWVRERLLGQETTLSGTVGDPPHYLFVSLYGSLDVGARESLQFAILGLLRELIDRSMPEQWPDDATVGLLRLTANAFRQSPIREEAIESLLQLIEHLSPTATSQKESLFAAHQGLLELGFRGTSTLWEELSAVDSKSFAVLTFVGLSTVSLRSALRWLASVDWSSDYARVFESNLPTLLEDFGADKLITELSQILPVFSHDASAAIEGALRRHGVHEPVASASPADFWIDQIEDILSCDASPHEDGRDAVEDLAQRVSAAGSSVKRHVHAAIREIINRSNLDESVEPLYFERLVSILAVFPSLEAFGALVQFLEKVACKQEPEWLARRLEALTLIGRIAPAAVCPEHCPIEDQNPLQLRYLRVLRKSLETEDLAKEAMSQLSRESQDNRFLAEAIVIALEKNTLTPAEVESCLRSLCDAHHICRILANTLDIAATKCPEVAHVLMNYNADLLKCVAEELGDERAILIPTEIQYRPLHALREEAATW